MPTTPVKMNSVATKIVLLDGSVTESESSDFHNRQRYIYNYLYIDVASGGTVDIYTSPSGEDNTWIKFGATINASSVVTLPSCVPFVKVVRNAGTQAVTVTLCSGGRDQS